jgi:hypothetical protein
MSFSRTPPARSTSIHFSNSAWSRLRDFGRLRHLVEDADAGYKQPVNPDADKKCSTSSAAPFSEAMLKAKG